MNKMKIEIWSDIACPYCYIGKHKLDKALESLAFAKEIEIIWKSYHLDPDLPKGNYGKSYFEYLSDKQGFTIEQVKEDFNNIQSLGKEVGLKFNPDTTIVTNTMDALRFVKLAAKYAVADQAEEVLFKAYFTDGEDISSKDVLIALASKVGIPAEDLIRSIDSFEYSDNIKSDIFKADNELNLEYIPFYLINNKHIIQGSVSVEEYISVITNAYEDWKINGTPDENSDKEDIIKGKACSIDGTCSI